MLNAINKCLQQAFPLNSDKPKGGCNLILFDTIQEKDTGDLFVTFSHSVGILGHQTKAFTVITVWGTVHYSIRNFTIQLQCWAIGFIGLFSVSLFLHIVWDKQMKVFRDLFLRFHNGVSTSYYDD